MTEPRSDDLLGDLLRAGDPAGDDSEPTLEESASMRRMVLDRMGERRPLWRWLPAAAAVAATLALAVWLGSARPGDPTPETATAPVSPSLEADEQPVTHHQQIQFATDSGTRIIWVLNPDLTL